MSRSDAVTTSSRDGRPPLTVIVPAKDMASGVRRIVAALEGIDGVETVVVDDGSTPPLDVAATTLVRHAEPAGPAAARNAGLEAASGRYIMFVDADDVVHVDAVRALVGDLADARAAVLCQPLARDRSADGLGPYVATPSPFLAAYDRSWPAVNFLPGGYVVRRALLQRLGGFDAAVRYGEHHELAMRLLSTPDVTWAVRGERVVTKIDRDQESRAAQYAVDRSASALYTVRKHRQLMARHPVMLADYRSVAGTALADQGHPLRAVRCLVGAFVADPSPLRLARIPLAMLGRYRRRFVRLTRRTVGTGR